jgi:deoxyribonuclease IV
VLIGAHVSTAGGLAKALERGVEIECEAIQIFPQSPRMWRPTAYTEADFAEFREAMAGSPVQSALIHAIYLINCASTDSEVSKKSAAALVNSLRVGDAIGSAGVVLHAGARKGEPHEPSMKRAAKGIKAALDDSDSCPLLLENTAGSNGPLGRNVDELADLLDLSGGDERLGICIDCCHLFASGVDIREPEGLSALTDELDRKIGLNRLRALHVNDSAVPLGANRDKHAIVGEGELGKRGLATFLSEPRFEGLPAVLETGRANGAPDRSDVRTTKRLRRDGLRRRSG